MTIGVYAIFSAIDGLCLYVGQSSNIEERWKAHLKNLRADKHLQSFSDWFRQHDLQNDVLDFRILDVCENDENEKNRLEIKWFHILSPQFYGKEPSLNEKWSLSEETKNKISESLKRGRRKHVYACLFCEKMFLSITLNRKFCSPKCTQKYPENRIAKFLDRKDQIYNLYWIEGKSRREIGEVLGIKRSSVGNLMRDLEIPTRPKGGKSPLPDVKI